jgi:hypothetical protein
VGKNKVMPSLLDRKIFGHIDPSFSEFLLVERNKVVPSRLDDAAIRLLETSGSAIQLTAR